MKKIIKQLWDFLYNAEHIFYIINYLWEIYLILFTLFFSLNIKSNFFQTSINDNKKYRFLLFNLDWQVIASLIILTIVLVFLKLISSKKIPYNNYRVINTVCFFIIIVTLLFNIYNTKKVLSETSLLSADLKRSFDKKINILSSNDKGEIEIYTQFNFGDMQSAPMSNQYTLHNTVLATSTTAQATVGPSFSIGNIPIMSLTAQADGDGYQGTQNRRVGINTITPEVSLDVNGDAQVSGNLFLKGKCIVLFDHQKQKNIYLQYNSGLRNFEEKTTSFCK